MSRLFTLSYLGLNQKTALKIEYLEKVIITISVRGEWREGGHKKKLDMSRQIVLLDSTENKLGPMHDHWPLHGLTDLHRWARSESRYQGAKFYIFIFL